MASHNNGRLTGVDDVTYSDAYTYDLLGNTASVAKALAGQTYSAQYQYNEAGLLTRMTYPSSMYLTGGYDNTGQLSSITENNGKQYASGLTYNPAGQVTGYAMGLSGGSVNATLGHSAQRLQLGSLSYTYGANTLLGLTYGYTQNGGNNGQITSVIDGLSSGRSATYGYDALGRLTSFNTTGSASYPQQVMSWSYDRYGNRLTQVRNGGTQTVNPSPSTNRLNLSYDANGNLTNDGTYGLTWDAENRIVSYAGGSVTNQYDANGLRVRRTKQGSSDVIYVFAGAQPIAEYAPGALPSNPSVQYVYLGSQLIASKASSTYTFYERDQLSIRGILADATPGSPTEQGHLPFGENWYGSNLKWKFTSYERDSDVGDDFAVFRRYQYVYGRFSSPDPVMGWLGDPQTWNRYTYVANGPLTFVDPLGLDLAEPCFLDDCGGDGGGGYGYCPPERENCDPGCDPIFGCDPGGYGGGAPPNSGGGPTSSGPPTAGGDPPIGNNFLGFNLFCSGHNVYTGPIPNPTPQPSVWSCVLYFLNWNLGKIGAFATNVGIAGSVFVPLVPIYEGAAAGGVNIPFAILPGSKIGCLGIGPGASAPASKSLNAGPLLFGNLHNAQAILSGWSFSFGMQPNPGRGAQYIWNLSGPLGGPTAGSVGTSIAFTISKCAAF